MKISTFINLCILKVILITSFITYGGLSLYSQQVQELNCVFVVDSVDEFESSSRGLIDSENGWYLPASGTIKILIVFAEAQYTPNRVD